MVKYICKNHLYEFVLVITSWWIFTILKHNILFDFLIVKHYLKLSWNILLMKHLFLLRIFSCVYSQSDIYIFSSWGTTCLPGCIVIVGTFCTVISWVLCISFCYNLSPFPDVDFLSNSLWCLASRTWFLQHNLVMIVGFIFHVHYIVGQLL